MEAGIGAQGVEDEQRVEPRHPTVTFLSSFLQPGDGLVVVTEPHANASQKATTDILLTPSPLKIPEDRERFMFLPSDAHAACAEFGSDGVRAEGGARSQRHGRGRL